MKKITKNFILYFVIFTTSVLESMTNPNEPLGSLLNTLSQDRSTLLSVLSQDVIRLIKEKLNPLDILYQECELMRKDLVHEKAKEIPDFKQCGMSKIEDYFRALMAKHLENTKEEDLLLKFIQCPNIFWYLVQQCKVNVNAPIRITRYNVVDHYDQSYTEESTYLMNTVNRATHKNANPHDRKIGLAVVRRLIAAGANVNLFDTFNTESPLHIAAKQKPSEEAKEDYLSLVAELLQTGANPNLCNCAGFNVLFKALEFNNNVILPLLLKNQVNRPLNCRGHTPLCCAATRSPQLTQILLSAGADVNERNVQGKTPLDIAREEKNYPVRTILLQAPNQQQSPTIMERLCMKLGH